MWKMTSVLFCLVLIASCQYDRASFSDRYLGEALAVRRNHMRSAPIIVVGVIQQIDRIGGPVSSVHVEGLTLQLFRARAQKDVALKGDVRRDFEFFYFGPDPRDGMAGFPKFWLQPSQRRILFLEPSVQGYRAVGDYLDYTEWVHSGSPNQACTTGETDIGKAIACVMLTPGKGFDETAFSNGMVNASHTAVEFSTEAFVVELLKHLVTHSSAKIRTEACRILRTQFRQIVC
jgi:hypothetical protein